MLHDEHAEGDSDGDGESHGNENESEMIERSAQYFGAVLKEKIPRVHRVTPSETARDAVKAWTSG